MRLLRGQRNWPRDVRFPVAVAMCMKSIASHSRESVRLNRARHCSLDNFEEELAEAGGVSPSPEEHLSAVESFREQVMEVDRAKTRFTDAPIGRLVLEGIVRGLSAQKIRRRHALSRAEYKAARQRAIRHAPNRALVRAPLSAKREPHLNQRGAPPAATCGTCPGGKARIPQARECRCCHWPPSGNPSSSR